MEIELRKIITTHEGVCHMFRMVTLQSDQTLMERRGHFLIKHNKSLQSSDVPKSFNIYITPRHEWHGIVNGLWPGKYPPLKIETSSYSLPLDVNVHLSSNYFEPHFEQKCIIIKHVFSIIVSSLMMPSIPDKPPVDLYWFFEISIWAFISN